MVPHQTVLVREEVARVQEVHRLMVGVLHQVTLVLQWEARLLTGEDLEAIGTKMGHVLRTWTAIRLMISLILLHQEQKFQSNISLNLHQEMRLMST